MKCGMGSSGYEDNENVPFGMCPNYSESGNKNINPQTDNMHLFKINVLSIADVEEELDQFLRNEY